MNAAPPTHPALFGYHAGRRAIVMHKMAGASPELMVVPIEAFRALGFQVSEADLARCLPRFDPPRVELASGPGAMQHAIRESQRKGAVESAAKGRR